MTSSAFTDAHTLVGGRAKLGPARVSGGVLLLERENAAPLESRLYYLGASYPITPALTLDAELSRNDEPNDPTMAVVRGVYSLSKRTAVYAMAARIRNQGASATSVSAGGTVGAGMGQTGLMAGIRHTF